MEGNFYKNFLTVQFVYARGRLKNLLWYNNRYVNINQFSISV